MDHMGSKLARHSSKTHFNQYQDSERNASIATITIKKTKMSLEKYTTMKNINTFLYKTLYEVGEKAILTNKTTFFDGSAEQQRCFYWLI